MSEVGLMFVGAVLFVNGVGMLGAVDPRSSAVFNLFVGSLQVLSPVYLIITADNQDDILAASGIFLFGFTYLYVGITALAKLDSSGLGWYCGWVSIMAFMYGITAFTHFDDTKFGLMWMSWSFLWGLFFVLIALRRDSVTKYAGWVTIIIGWITCTIPGFAILNGWWEDVSTGVAIAVAAAMAVAFVALIPRTIPKRSSQTDAGISALPLAH